MKARVLAGMSKGQAYGTVRKENSKRRNAEKKKEKGDCEVHMQLRKHGGQGLRGAARTDHQGGGRAPVQGHTAAMKEGPACSGERKAGEEREWAQQKGQGGVYM